MVYFVFYTAGWNVWGDWVLAVYHHNHKNWVPSVLTHNMWLIFIRMKQKKIFFWKNKIKNGQLKKRSFFKIANYQYFFWKFHGVVLGLLKFIDAKGIGMAQPIWSWGLPTEAQKMAKKHKKCIFGLFLSLCRTASRPYRMSHTNALRINEFY